VRVILQILFLLISSTIFAGNVVDSVRIESALYESPWRSYTNSFEYNPAATFSVPVKYFSNLGATYSSSKADNGLHLVQEGDGASAFKLHSESFQVDKKYRFFGKAYFLTDQKNNVGWRDVEDYELLSPYLVADSIGGTYKRESYFLSGGATVRLRHIEWGIRAAYQGGVSYRQVDPRPRNTVSVIHINPGVNYSNGKWNIGWFGDYERYRQNVDIQVEKEGRKIYFYFMQGFGIYNRQFSGLDDTFSRIYKGNKFTTGFNINFGDKIQSTDALISVSQNRIDGTENSNRTPYQITHNQITAQLSHEQKLFKQTLFLKGLYNFRQTIGNETQYTPVTLSPGILEWQFASKSDRYQQLNHNAQFSALLANKNLSRFSVWEQLSIDWQNSKQNYYYPYYHQFIQNISGAGVVGINYPLRKCTLVGSVKAGYKKNLSSSLFQAENNEITDRLIIPDYDFMHSDISFYQLNMKFRFPISKALLGNISVDGGLQNAETKKAWSTNVCFSLNF
jgi:hypothetical protein